jgi:hypothetical protein
MLDRRKHQSSKIVRARAEIRIRIAVALMKFLSAPAAAPVIKKTGMDPG